MLLCQNILLWFWGTCWTILNVVAVKHLSSWSANREQLRYYFRFIELSYYKTLGPTQCTLGLRKSCAFTLSFPMDHSSFVFRRDSSPRNIIFKALPRTFISVDSNSLISRAEKFASYVTFPFTQVFFTFRGWTGSEITMLLLLFYQYISGIHPHIL